MEVFNCSLQETLWTLH